METVLYQYWRSSASWRVRWALGVKNIAFTSVPIDITKGDQDLAEHRARNPVGHVPALFIDGKIFAESVAIFEYLDETRPVSPLYPKSPLTRARVRQAVELVNSAIQPYQNLITLRRVPGAEAEKRAWAKYWNERGLVALEALVANVAAEIPSDGRFCVGNELTAADLFLVPQLVTARRFDVDLTPMPRLRAIEAAVTALPHAAAALPERQPGAPA